jgi:hypothetical protein
MTSAIPADGASAIASSRKVRTSTLSACKFVALALHDFLLRFIFRFAARRFISALRSSGVSLLQ